MTNEPSYDYSKNAELIKAAQAGDKAAMEELISGNMGLVRSIVPRFADRGVEYDDLMQIGAMGMIKAVKSYTAEYGTVFLHGFLSLFPRDALAEQGHQGNRRIQ